MKNATLLFAMLFTSFFIMMGLLAFAAGVPPVVKVGISVFDWVSDHAILTALAVSEAVAVLPSKAKGIIHGAFIVGKKIYSLTRGLNKPTSK